MLPRLETTTRRWILLPPLLLLLLGFTWSIAAPLGSSADEDFHSVNIWCAWGDSDLCSINEISGQVLAPQILVESNCYVGFPSDVSAGCLNELGIEPTLTNRFAINQTAYSPIYFRTMRAFAGENFDLSTHLIRMANVVLAAGLLLWALAIAPNPIRRGLALSWGLAMVPVGIFFIASLNPSAWLIPAIGTFWVFLSTLITNPRVSSKHTIATWLGLVVTVIVAIGARTDSILYLMISTLAVVVWRYRDLINNLGPKRLTLMLSVLFMTAFTGLSIFRDRYPSINLSFPGAQTTTDQPVAFLKTLVEFPAFFLGLVGAQGPQSGLSTGGNNQYLEGFRVSGFYYGIGWMDFNLPSLVGILTGLSIVAIFFLTIQYQSRSQKVALLIIALAIVAVVILSRATYDFERINYIQPRYLFPMFLAFLGIALSTEISSPKALLTRSQAILIYLALLTAGSIAWLATATRYAVGPNAAYTNFGQTPEWWWNIGPGRFGWFLITVVVSGLWLFSTVWIWGRVRSVYPESHESRVEVAQ